MTNLHENSLFAYNTIKPDLGKRQQQVYDVINKFLYPVSAKFIANDLSMPINRITGRINELMYDKQLIKVARVTDNENYYTNRLETSQLKLF